MEICTFKMILAIVLIIAGLIAITLALILYVRHNVDGLWIALIVAVCIFMLDIITLTSTFQNDKKSSTPKSIAPPQK